MRAVVLGMGLSGRAVFSYLQERGYEVAGVDRGGCWLDEKGAVDLAEIDLVVKSPGVAPDHRWVSAAKEKGIRVVGEIDLALAELKKQGKRLLAVTGSNGKTTTTALTAHLLNEAGVQALAAGNIGVPLLGQISSGHEVYVVELSSFQLESMELGPIFDAAVILNITPNHLDRHKSFDEYVQAKWRLARCLKEGAPLYVGKGVACACAAKTHLLDEKRVETILSLGYRGSIYPHDLENAAAAFALAQIPDALFVRGMASFKKPPHRLEFVRMVKGVRYINDSKATSVDAVIKAVEAVPGPLLVIAGGVDKGGDYGDWLPLFKTKVNKVFALGQAAVRIKESLQDQLPVELTSGLQEAVSLAAAWARDGDTVLLAPGCSSFDQFQDYQARGEAFRRFVNAFVE